MHMYYLLVGMIPYQDELETEKDDLQLRLQEMDKAVTQANETGQADLFMRTEIDHLKQDL